jgi:hypothetical protein
LTAWLHPSRQAAEAAKDFIDHVGCGGGCWQRHEVVELGAEVDFAGDGPLEGIDG